MAGVDWSKLPIELWSLIGNKLDAAADCVRFRAVSKSWRSLLPFCQPPWLMLAESKLTLHQQLLEETVKPCPYRAFVVVGEQHIHLLELPEVQDSSCIGSSGTWLIIIDLEKRMHLLNPFSRVQIDLPSLTKLLWKAKVIISSTPSSSDCIAIVIQSYSNKLAIARPGDAFWTTVETPLDWIQDIIFYRNQFYVLSNKGMVMVCNIGDGQQSPKFSVLSDEHEIIHGAAINYLVERLGELLLVSKFVDKKDHSYMKTVRFEVYKLDFASRKWSGLKSLGGHSLFLGLNTSVSVLASDYSGWVKRNCIYFTDDDSRGRGSLDAGVYDLEDNSIESHYDRTSASLQSPLIWIVPSYVPTPHSNI
ncbi:hypothetical protein AQUCO_00700725v1 [Aquilegia coerulea]|uniref:F-box domain-containing protein n=1 Tax=Aquilegia coerulea TaxID=218851 RepID=A0A2G5ELD4_AQUCA|nr:hypothetical protein AQUCO_00700725v1 [Aquilegia coerulea]